MNSDGHAVNGKKNLRNLHNEVSNENISIIFYDPELLDLLDESLCTAFYKMIVFKKAKGICVNSFWHFQFEYVLPKMNSETSEISLIFLHVEAGGNYVAQLSYYIGCYYCLAPEFLVFSHELNPLLRYKMFYNMENPSCPNFNENKTPAEQRDIFRPELFYNYINLRLKNN